MLYEGVRIVHDFFCWSAIIINILLVIVIIRKTPAKLRIITSDSVLIQTSVNSSQYFSSYSIILLNFAIIEVASALTSLFLFNRSILLNPGDAEKYSIFATTGPCRYTGSSRLCFAVSAFLSHGHCHFYILLGFSFFYRYMAIKYSTPSTTFLYTALFTIYAPTAIVFTIFGTSPILEECHLRRVVLENHPKFDFNSSAQNELLIGVEKSASMRLGMAWFQGVLIPAYVVIIVSSVLIHRLLSSSLRMSEKSRKMHKDIMQGLIFQAMLPLFYVVVIVINQVAQKHLLPENKDNGYVFITVSAMTLTASPLSTLFFIRPYRLALMSMFCCRSSSSYLYSPPPTSEMRRPSPITLPHPL